MSDLSDCKRFLKGKTPLSGTPLKPFEKGGYPTTEEIIEAAGASGREAALRTSGETTAQSEVEGVEEAARRWAKDAIATRVASRDTLHGWLEVGFREGAEWAVQQQGVSKEVLAVVEAVKALPELPMGLVDAVRDMERAEAAKQVPSAFTRMLNMDCMLLKPLDSPSKEADKQEGGQDE